MKTSQTLYLPSARGMTANTIALNELPNAVFLQRQIALGLVREILFSKRESSSISLAFILGELFPNSLHTFPYKEYLPWIYMRFL